jgi:hypothetical protein
VEEPPQYDAPWEEVAAEVWRHQMWRDMARLREESVRYGQHRLLANEYRINRRQPKGQFCPVG